MLVFAYVSVFQIDTEMFSNLKINCNQKKDEGRELFLFPPLLHDLFCYFLINKYSNFDVT